MYDLLGDRYDQCSSCNRQLIFTVPLRCRKNVKALEGKTADVVVKGKRNILGFNNRHNMLVQQICPIMKPLYKRLLHLHCTFKLDQQRSFIFAVNQ